MSDLQEQKASQVAGDAQVKPRVLLVGSQKGGVGKTTSTINLATVCAAEGKHVLVIDTDPVSSVAASLHLDVPKSCGLEHAVQGDEDAILTDIEPGLDVLPCSPDDFRSDQRIGDWITKIANAERDYPYDMVFVDTSPYSGPRSRDLLVNANELLLVIRAEPLSYRTLPGFLHDLRRLDDVGMAPNLRGVVLTLPPNEELGGRWEKGLRNRFGSKMFSAAIPYDPVVGYALLKGLPVTVSEPESIPAQQYRPIAHDLLDDMEPQ